MTAPLTRRRATLAAGFVGALALLAAPLAASTPAVAASPASTAPARLAGADGSGGAVGSDRSSGSAGSAGCGGLGPAGSARTSRTPDGPSYSQRQLRRIARDLDQRLAARRFTVAGQARIGAELRIAVHVHVLRNADQRGATLSQVRRQLKVLNDAYAGLQSSKGAVTRFNFRLASFEKVRSNRWYHASMGSAADTEMRRALHRGGRADLNLYVLRPRTQAGGVVLGWSSAPWNASRRPALDGVSIHQDSLPGGSLAPYDRGDTAVHETGHWLGLLHTFEGGCSEPNDLVVDTPQEAQPSSSCTLSKDTCAADGLDPVRNFMDYAVDTCMNMFTPGQVARMTDNWLAYRTP